MSEWISTAVPDVRPGDRVRTTSGAEFSVARVDAPFLGRETMVCFIEDTPTRWHAYPQPTTGRVEVLAGS